MKVSIITATYNSEKTIKETLSSLENQTYQNIEYIIIDGSSTDNTLNVIKQNCTRVCKVISEKDNGIYDALNKGINAATGNIIGFLHSDDLFASPQTIKNIVNTFTVNKTDAVYGDLQYVSATDINKIIRIWKSGEYNKNKLKYGWMPPHPTFYMRRELYKKLGGFDLNYRIAGDYDSILRYLYVNNISMSYCHEVLVKMRIGGVSNRNIKTIITKSLEDIRAMKSAELFVPTSLLIKNFSKIPQFFKR